MNEIFWLYLLTRLDSINCALGLVVLVCGIVMLFFLVFRTFLSLDGYNNEQELKAIDAVLKYWKIPAVCLIVGMFVPSQKDAMFILAGTGVIEAAKTDTAQRIAGKSVDVVEKYLDEMLKEGKK